MADGMCTQSGAFARSITGTCSVRALLSAAGRQCMYLYNGSRCKNDVEPCTPHSDLRKKGTPQKFKLLLI